MFEDHITKIRNGLTLEEMTKISIPLSRKDPITKQLLPDFHFSSKKSISLKKKRVPIAKENITLVDSRNIPSNHYIEGRFYAYSKAMITNKPLFSNFTKIEQTNTEKLCNTSLTESKFQTSHYPHVPLTKEMIEKVENVNSFYEIEKKSSKKSVLCRSSTPISIGRRTVKDKKFLDNLQS